MESVDGSARRARAAMSAFPPGTRGVYCGRRPRKWATGTGATPMCANVTSCLAERDRGIRATLSAEKAKKRG